MFYQIRNIKPRYQGLMLKFSCNDLNQRYYLNEMWMWGAFSLILYQLFYRQFSSNENLHFIQGCCLLVVSCRLIAISAEPQHQPDHKYLQKVPILNKYKKAKKNTKKWKGFSVPLADLSWTMLVTWRLLVSCFKAFNVFKNVTEIWCIATKLLS